MASIPDLCYSSADYCYTFPYHDPLSGLPGPTAVAIGGGGAMCGGQDDFLVPFGGENGVGNLVDGAFSASSPAESFKSSSTSSLPEQLGISDGGVPAFSNFRSSVMGLHGIAGVQNYGGGTSYGGVPQYVNVNGLEFAEECCATSFLPELIKPVGLVSGQKNWGMQSNQMQAIEESNMMKVGRYSEEERKERILRYLKKRSQRNFNKTIKYACRKTLADRRVRVRGRFARNNELICDDHHQRMEAEKNNNIDPTCKDIKSCCDDALQIKFDDEEDWLQDFALCCWVNGGAN